MIADATIDLASPASRLGFLKVMNGMVEEACPHPVPIILARVIHEACGHGKKAVRSTLACVHLPPPKLMP